MKQTPYERPAADLIREGILQGVFAPRQRLIEADLCEQFDLTRASVRAALQQLATEGLVETQHNKGARVRAISLDEAIEITEIRLQIEAFVAQLAAKRVTPESSRRLRELAAAMRKAVKTVDIPRYGDLNVELHALIRTIANHQTANHVLAQLNAQSARHHIRLAMSPGRTVTSLAQHEAIIQAICRGDSDTAYAAMQSHIQSVIDTLRSTEPGA